MNSVRGCAWFVMLVACAAPPKRLELPRGELEPSTLPAVSEARVPSPSASSAEPQLESSAKAAPVELRVELVLEAVERAWPVGERVLAQTLVTPEQGGMLRELHWIDGAAIQPLGRLSRALSLGQFVRVERVYGAWSGPLWLEVHADLVSQKRVELHRFDAKRQLSSRVGQWVGSMQSQLAAAELPDGWLFLFHDPLATERKSVHRFAGSAPLPSLPALFEAGPDCGVPYAVCGLRSGPAGSLQLLAIRCERTPLTVSWSERRARPRQQIGAVSPSPLTCAEHPDQAQGSVEAEAGRLLARYRDGAQVRITTPDGLLAARVADAFSIAGRAFFLAGGGLYREVAANDASLGSAPAP